MNWYTYKEDTKMFDMYVKNRIICDCGHRVFLGNNDYIVCSNCGRYVFKNKRCEMIYRLKETKNRLELNNESKHKTI